MTRCIAPVLALALAVPVSAQEWQVARERFTYVGTDLTIAIDVDAPGSLRLIRGEPGTVRVAGRAQRGFTSAGLRDSDVLTLAAAGDGPVDYLVSVPERVFVRVKLPGQPFAEAVGSYHDSRTFEWRAAGEKDLAAAAPSTAGAAAETSLAPPSLYTTFVADRAPRIVSLPDLAVVHSVTVRVEGDRFRVASSRPLSLEPGDPENLVIRPADPPLDLEIHVPPFTGTFTLRAGDATAFTIDGENVNAFCTPLIQQRLSDGRRWFTFTPADGRLQCEAATDARHRG